MKSYLKAVIGALVAGLSVLSADLGTGGALSAADYLAAVIATLVAFGAVFQTPNQP